MNCTDRSWWRLQWAELGAWCACFATRDDSTFTLRMRRRLWARKEL